jgi:hypothetical protein
MLPDWLRIRALSIFLAFAGALASFIWVVLKFPSAIAREIANTGQAPVYDASLPIAMGLLGSSVFILYNIALPERLTKLRSWYLRGDPWRVTGSVAIRLFLGPVAGWLVYAILFGQIGPRHQFLWLPFIAGFSSDLLIGIINQIEHAIKLTLGIESSPPARPQAHAGENPKIQNWTYDAEEAA